MLSKVAPDSQRVVEALESLPEVDIEFNERGRLESVSLPE